MLPTVPYVIPPLPDCFLDESPVVEEIRARANATAARAARSAHLAVLHPSRSRGHATVMSPSFDGSTPLRGRELVTAPQAAEAGYVSLQRYNGARTGNDLAAINAFAWADVENLPAGLAPEDAAGIILERLDDAGVPRPSYVMFSGRGLWLVWLATRALPAKARGRVTRALRALWGERIGTGRGAASERVSAKAASLAAIWDGFDLDRSVGDMARVHRVAGSVNPKSGETVRMVWPASMADIERQDFEAFADSVLPFTRQETEAYLAERDAAREARRARAEAEGRPVETRPARPVYGVWGCLREELLRLAAHLGPERIKAIGRRDLLAHHIACTTALSGLGGDESSWAAELAPVVGLSERHLRRYLKPVADRLRRHETGERGERGGREVSLLYTYRTDRIVADLGIDADLARAAGLVRLVPGLDARPALTPAERQAQRRRRQGAATSQERAARAKALSGRCMALAFSGEARTPDAEVARQLGVSRVSVARAMDRFEFGGDDWASQFETETETEVEADAIQDGSEPEAVTHPSRSLSVGFASSGTPAPTAPAKAQLASGKRSKAKAAPTSGPMAWHPYDPCQRLLALYEHHLKLGKALGWGEACFDPDLTAMQTARDTLQYELQTGRRVWPVGRVPDRSPREQALRQRLARLRIDADPAPACSTPEHRLH